MTALADRCLWRENPRLSVGLFAIGAAAIILANRPGMRWSGRAVFIVALICGAAAESGVDLCFSNVLVILALTIALAGESYYESLQSGWNRWSEAAWTMAKTPGRWLWLAFEIREQTLQTGSTPRGFLGRIARAAWIIVPGLAITLFFAAILSNGNALFAKFAANWTAAVADWLLALHLSLARCWFWAFVACISLPLLRPSPAPRKDRIWTRELPRLPELTTKNTARMQSAVMLGFLNILFCWVNPGSLGDKDGRESPRIASGEWPAAAGK